MFVLEHQINENTLDFITLFLYVINKHVKEINMTRRKNCNYNMSKLVLHLCVGRSCDTNIRSFQFQNILLKIRCKKNEKTQKIGL